MKTVLVTGANGQLGTIRCLSGAYNRFQFLFTDVDTLDICKEESVDAFIQAHPVDYILNCAAYTAVDKAEENLELCEQINRDAVANLARAAQKCQAKVIHVSTDYVFDGLFMYQPIMYSTVHLVFLTGKQTRQIPNRCMVLPKEPGKRFCKRFVRMPSLSRGRGSARDLSGCRHCPDSLVIFRIR